MAALKNLGMQTGGAGGELTFGGRHGLGEGEAWGAQQEEKFTGPEQNVQQAAALKIGESLRLQADVEGFSGAFLAESAHGAQVNGISGQLPASRVTPLKPFVATLQEVVQAENLVIQSSNRGAATRTHPAISFPKDRIHSTQAH